MNEPGQQPSKERWDASQIPASVSLTSPNAESDLGWRVGVGLVEEGGVGLVGLDAAILRRGPKLPLCSPPSPPLLFSPWAKRENACATMPALLHLS